MATEINSKKVGEVTVTLWNTEDLGLSNADGGKYVLICETHSSIIQDTNKVRLWTHSSQVTNWCEECQIEKVGA
jgi:hypothetical protein